MQLEVKKKNKKIERNEILARLSFLSDEDLKDVYRYALQKQESRLELSKRNSA